MIRPDEFFQLLSDETRLRCLLLLEAKGELCVCDLTTALKMIQPKISRHLAILRKFDIVADRRAGIWIYYRIHPKLPKWAHQVLSASLKHMTTIKPYSSDLIWLKNSYTIKGGTLSCNN